MPGEGTQKVLAGKLPRIHYKSRYLDASADRDYWKRRYRRELWAGKLWMLGCFLLGLLVSWLVC